MPVPVEECFVKGDLAHAIVERHLGESMSVEEALKDYLDDWLENNCHIANLRPPAGIDKSKLILYATQMGKLLYRCSAACITEDAIRNKNGEVPKSPLEYPPTQLNVEIKARGLNNLRQEIDIMASQLNANFERMSLANIAAQAASYGYGFFLPEWVEEVVHIEYDFAAKDKEPVYLDESKETQWMGRIDLVIRTTGDGIGIIDHKSGAKRPEQVDVLWHPQLNMYVEKYYEQTGILADYVGIYHMPTAEFIMAAVDIDIVHELSSIYKETQRKILDSGTDTESFARGGLPSKEFSCCLRRDYRSGAVSRVCPYIRLCWPAYAGDINHELTNHIGRG